VLSASDADIRRAATKCPRAEYKGKTTLADANKVLNVHLTEMEHLSTRACERFSAGELQQLSRQLYGVADPALLEVYEETQDNRRQTYGSEDEMQADYTRLNGLVADREPELHDVLRDGLCHRAVMWFVHHLPVEKQLALAANGITIPLLPLSDHTAKSNPGRALAVEDVAAQAVHETYEKLTTCQGCHIGGIPNLGVKEVKPTTPKQMARRCYTDYAKLFNITCGPCDGVAGLYWGDDDDKYFAPDPCVMVGTPESIPMEERVLAAFPPQFSVDVVSGSDRWGRTTNPAGHVKTPFPPIIDSMYGKISGKWFADITPDSDLWLLRHDTSYTKVHFNGTAMPLLHFDVSEIHSQTRQQMAANNSGPMVSLIHGLPDFIPGGCTCVKDPVGVPDVAHARTSGLVPDGEHMEYLGRINLTLAEHDGEVVLVDHWANWFFHVFMDVDQSVPHYGKAPRRLASAYAGTAVYSNWQLGDPKIADPTVWTRGIPVHPERVGPDHGKFCMNPTKVPMCNNISTTTFPPKPAAPVQQPETPWATVHKTFLPSFSANQAHMSHLLSKVSRQ